MSDYIEVDRGKWLLPERLEEWVPPDHLSRFAIEIAERVSADAFGGHPGKGRPGYEPAMMLALIVFCYSIGETSSRQIERRCREHLPTMYITGRLQPDHDTICSFRTDNEAAIEAAFLLLTEEAVKRGMIGRVVSVDGTHMAADASLRRNVSLARIRELLPGLRGDLEEALTEAVEGTDEKALKKASDLERLEANLSSLLEILERRKEEEVVRRRQEYERKRARGGKGRAPKEPDEPDERKIVGNLTDSDSRAQRKGHRSALTQGYNPQLTVCAENQVICGARVADGNDMGELVANVEASATPVDTVLADAGYAKGEDVEKLKERGVDPLVATGGFLRRKYDFRPEGKASGKERGPAKDEAVWKIQLREQLEKRKGLYALRAQSVEPVFGTIKHTMGIRRFRVRGRAKVAIEWLLIATAFNLRRLHNFGYSAPG